MQISQSATRIAYPLSPRKVIKKTITGTLGTLFILFFLGIIFSPFITAFVAIFLGILNEPKNVSASTFFSILPYYLFGALFFALVITILQYFYQKWYFATYYYEMMDNLISIKKGPITPREINIPYERVQDVYIDQDIFDRIFGLYDVHFSSATFSSNYLAHIDGLEREPAEKLKQVLIQKVYSKINKKQDATG